jgi:hypothetical protein
MMVRNPRREAHLKEKKKKKLGVHWVIRNRRLATIDGSDTMNKYTIIWKMKKIVWKKLRKWR